MGNMPRSLRKRSRPANSGHHMKPPDNDLRDTAIYEYGAFVEPYERVDQFY